MLLPKKKHIYRVISSIKYSILTYNNNPLKRQRAFEKTIRVRGRAITRSGEKERQEGKKFIPENVHFSPAFPIFYPILFEWSVRP